MKQIIILFLTLLLTVGSVYAQIPTCSKCKKPVNECPYNGRHPKTAEKSPKSSGRNDTYINIDGKSANTLELQSWGDRRTLTVNTDASSWSLDETPGWCTVKRQGNTLSVVVDTNRTGSPRTGTITVRTPSSLSASVTLRQKQQPASSTNNRHYLLVQGSANNYFVNCNSADGCTYSISVSTDIRDGYTLWAVPSWCTVSNKTSQGFQLTIQPNNTSSERRDYFKVKAGGKEVRVDVIQSTRKRRPQQDLTFDARLGLTVASTSTHFSDSYSSSAINYGVNNLLGSYTAPDYSAGAGLELALAAHYHLSNAFWLNSGLALTLHNYSNQFHSYDWGYTLSSGTVYIDQTSTEKYRFAYLQVPVVVTYRVELSRDASLNFGGGFLMGLGLRGRLKTNGHIYNEYSSTNTYDESNVTGKINLFTGSYEYDQTYTTGVTSTYRFTGKTTAPYRRVDFAFRLYADVELEQYVFAMSYDIGLRNIARKVYWEAPDSMVPGYLEGGAPIYFTDAQPLWDYRQTLHHFTLSVGYKF